MFRAAQIFEIAKWPSQIDDFGVGDLSFLIDRLSQKIVNGEQRECYVSSADL